MNKASLMAGATAIAAWAMVVGAQAEREAGKDEAAAATRDAQELVDRVMFAEGDESADLLLLGTFHFKDAGLDEYKPQFPMDVMSPERQKEIDEVLDRLAAWKPTKICVEVKADRQGAIDERYQSYLKGEFELNENELYQIGFKLAKRLGHERVHAVDANGRWYEPRVDPMEWAQENGQAGQLDAKWMERFFAGAQLIDEYKTKHTLRETLLFMNAEPLIEAQHGVYLVGTFAVGDEDEYPGVDGFLSQWYSRNLRILANVRRVTESAQDRVLVIIGAGHVPIIRHAANASPEFEIVEVADVLVN